MEDSGKPWEPVSFQYVSPLHVSCIHKWGDIDNPWDARMDDEAIHVTLRNGQTVIVRKRAPANLRERQGEWRLI